MAVANILTFGGISTATYGLVVEGSGDYSAPKRAVETIEIPGRNGAFQLDKGYYENIEVEYNIVVKDATQADFRDAIDSYRNAIVSQIGYQRLEDTYHPNEYRMAMYAGGLDEDPSFHGNGAIFKVKFDCKPQRFLTSGEQEIEVDSGDSITNPTPFEASPLLEAWGNGLIAFNGHSISIEDVLLGKVILANATGETTTTIINFSTASLNTGDPMTLEQSKKTSYIELEKHIEDVILTTTAGTLSATFSAFIDRGNLVLYATIPETSFVQGTSSTKYSSVSCAITYSDDTTTTVTHQITMRYAATTDQILMSDSITGSDVVEVQRTYNFGTLYGISTLHTAGNPIYIDCDLGECYKIVNDEAVSLNKYIDLGAKLPTLAVGANEITFGNTITDLKVIPRWWIV